MSSRALAVVGLLSLVLVMNRAAYDIVLLWLTAWERAGRPDLR